MKKNNIKFALFLVLFAVLPSASGAAKSKTKTSPSTSASSELSKKEASSPKVESKLNLGDLGFTTEQSSVDLKAQQQLNTRSSMLQTHQVLGLVTLGLMTATYFTAPDHKAASVWHRGFAFATAASYFTTAGFSLFAPEVPGVSEKGWNIKIHKALMFVHLPGMILTPIAGLKAQSDRKAGREPSGIGKYKETLANVTYFSFATAALTMVVNF